MNPLSLNLIHIIGSVPFLVVLMAALWLGKLLYDRTTKFSLDHELTNRDNHAVGAQFSLYLLGLMLAIVGTLQRGVEYNWQPLVEIALLSLLALLLMRVSIWLLDRFILSEFSIDKEMIRDRNVGTGFVVGGACVATGLIINGAASIPVAEGDFLTWISRILGSTLIYFVAGQVFLILGAKLYQSLASYDVHGVIEKDDNLAAGLAYGGYLSALGIILRAGTVLLPAGSATDKAILFVVAVLFGALLLFVAGVFANRFMLPEHSLSQEIVEDKNPSAGAVAASCYVCTALTYSWVIIA